MLYSLIFIIVLLLLSAYFSGMEIAYVSSNKVQLEIEKKQGGVIGNILEKLTCKPSKFIATMLVGNNITLVIYGIEMGKLVVAQLPPYFHNVLWQTVISTLVIVITGEFLPKVFFQIYSNTLLRALSPITYIFYLIFSPISTFVIWLSDNILHVFFNTQGDVTRLTFSKEELENYISEQIENMPEDKEMDSEVQIFQNALGFSQVKARDIMKPRTEIIAINIEESVEALRDLFVNSNYSKVLVYQENIDKITGIIYAKDLLPYLEEEDFDWRKIKRKAFFVPENKKLDDLLTEFQQRKIHLAIVVDEYGGTLGVVTLEDIIEEIVGEISDEYDMEDTFYTKMDDRNFLFDGKTSLKDFYRVLSVEEADQEDFEKVRGESETIAGFLLELIESFPEKKQEIPYKHYIFTIEDIDKKRIKQLKVTIR